MNVAASELSVIALGDSSNPHCHGGIPFAFCQAASRVGLRVKPVALNLDWTKWKRRLWNVNRLLSARGRGGYQYSAAFLDAAERQLGSEVLSGEVFSFSQHFPRAKTVKEHGGHITYYLDATCAQLTSGRGLDIRLAPDLRKQLLALERENYNLADRVIFWSHWAADSGVRECGADPKKVFVVLPGANVDLPEGYARVLPGGRPGIDREFVLGFVGKEWKRKGLPFLCDVRDLLSMRGWKVIVQCAGNAPTHLQKRKGVRFQGYIDKAKHPLAYPQFLNQSDIGCLFSKSEALGLSVLEFLRAGVPVAGFATEGPSETIPIDAGFRFSAEASVTQVSDELERYLQDENKQAIFNKNATIWGSILSWERSIGELVRVWSSNECVRSVRPELGLQSVDHARLHWESGNSRILDDPLIHAQNESGLSAKLSNE